MSDGVVTPEIRRDLRSSVWIGIYRSLAGFVFLLVAFSTFPGSKGAIALGLVVFNMSVAALVVVMGLHFKAENQLSNIAERKTRHTVVLAADPSWRGREPGEFWGEVDRRVKDELGEPPPPPKWWQQVLLTAGGFGGRLIWDLAVVGVALVLTGG